MIRPSARRVLPEFTERTSSGARTSDPYSKLLQERIVFLGTPIDETSANDVTAQFMYLEHQAPDRDIELYVNSPGGSFTAMTAIYDTMRYVACDVATTCLGQAGSSAAVLLAAGTPGKRAVLPGARVVIHQPALTEPVEGQASKNLAVHAGELVRVRALLEGDPRTAHGPRSRAGARGTSSGRRSSTPGRRWSTAWWTGSCPAAGPRPPRPARGDPPVLPPELPPLPALTRAEAEVIDRYLDVVDLLGRINPGRVGDTYRRPAGRPGAGRQGGGAA
ncbi:ATP-dependent Clp protease proteolytic subunit [Streptomyces tendae]